MIGFVYCSLGGWAVKTNDENQWIEANLGDEKHIFSIVTQGRHDSEQWVTSFKLQQSSAGTNFMTMKNTDGSDRIYRGNHDRNTKVTQTMPSGTKARFIRLLPQTWHNRISLRWGIFGC